MDKVDAPRIPEKFRDIVVMDSNIETSTQGPVAGEYNSFEDKIHLNPELLSIAVIAEEFYHRKQDQVLRSKGLTQEEYKENIELYNSACELGIIPIIREIEIRKNNPDADYNFWRYCMYAIKFTGHFMPLSDEAKKRFKNIVKGEPLFSGLSYVFKTIGSDSYDPECWQKMAVKDTEGKNYWGEIDQSRKEWREKTLTPT